MKGLIRGLDEFAVADDFSPEILVQRIQHPFPVVAAVVLSPPPAEDVPRGILRRHGEQPLEAIEVARGHFLVRLHLRPEPCQVEAFEKASSFLFLRVVDDWLVRVLLLVVVVELGGWVDGLLGLEELVEVGEVQAS